MSPHDEHDEHDAHEAPRALPLTHPHPYTHPALWLDRGLEALLAGALSAAEDAGDDAGVTAPLFGVHLRGVGASAALWRARDWAGERDLHASAVVPAGAPWAGEALTALVGARLSSPRPRVALLDDLHRADRPCVIALAALPLEARAPTLLLWSGEDAGPAAALWRALPARRRWRLALPPWGEEEWREWEGRAGGLRPLCARDPRLSPADQLRAAELAYESRLGRGEVLGGVSFAAAAAPAAAAAAALGPVVPAAALGGALGLDEGACALALHQAGLRRAGRCPRGGDLWRADVPARWPEALREAAALPPATLDALAGALDALYPPQDRWRVTAAAARLQRLRGAGPLPPLPFSAPSAEGLGRDLERLAPALTEDLPPSEVQGALAALCGLALEWAPRGPAWGRWPETLRALRLGVAAAERLRDPLRGARLLLALGAHLLSEGLGAQATEPLEAAAHLLAALGRAEEASRAAILCAEAALLAGRPRAALARLEAAERAARDLALPAAALLARYKGALLWLALGDAARAEAVLATLPPSAPGDLGDGVALARAAAALAAAPAAPAEERARRLRDARALLASRAPSPARDALDARARWLEAAGAGAGAAREAALADLLAAQRAAQAARDVGAWLSGQLALADCALEGLGAGGARGAGGAGGAGGAAEDAAGLASRAREGVEVAIKVASGARDRLRLAALYARLSSLLAHAGAGEAAWAARACAEAWAASLDISPSLPPAPALEAAWGGAAQGAAQGGAIRAQAAREVEEALSRWTATPLSASLS